MLKNILIGLLCFFCWTSSFAQIEQEEPTGNLSTPQEVAHQHIYYLTEEFYDVEKAAAALVGDPKKVTDKTREYAVKLKQIFDGKGLMVRADLIPDNPDYKGKKGWYIGYVGNQKWRVSGFLWAPATGVIHNVKNYKSKEIAKGPSDYLLENRKSKFVDVTKKANLFLEEYNMAVTVADYDNNGYKDLLVVRRGKLVYENESILYLNNGKSAFNVKEGHNIITKDLGGIGMAVESIDYNKDGKVDVVVGDERAKWHLFKNGLSNDNKSLTFEVKNSKKANISPLGALVEVSSCGNKQQQRVGTSASQYSLNHNTFVHFGLGNCSKTIKIKVTYSNGEVIEKSVKTSSKEVVIGK